MKNSSRNLFENAEKMIFSKIVKKPVLRKVENIVFWQKLLETVFYEMFHKKIFNFHFIKLSQNVEHFMFLK